MATATTAVFKYVGESLENATTTFISDVASDTISTIYPWGLAGLELYVVLYGYQMIFGTLHEPYKNGLMKMAKVMIVGLLALNVDTYLDQIVPAFRGVEEGLTSAFGGGPGGSIYDTLDNSLSRGLEIILQCKQKAGNAGLGDIAEALGWYIIGAIIAVGFALVVVVGGVAILMSTIYLKIMFAVGPFFIMALMFPVTAKFFDSWAGVTLNHILIVALTTVVLTLSITIYDHQITKSFLADGNVVIPDNKNMLQISLELLLIAAALYAVVRGVVPLAAALAGGISMAVMDVRSLMDNVNSGRRGVQKSLELGLGAGKGLYNIGKRVTQNLRGNSVSNGGNHKMAYNSGIKERLQRAQGN